jgi:hypothetical protein
VVAHDGSTKDNQVQVNRSARATSFPIGGTLSGMGVGKSLTLSLNEGNDLTLQFN